MTDTTDTLTNQTLFSNQEPLLQREGSELGPSSDEVDPQVLAGQKKRKKLFIFAGALGIVLVILLIALVALSPKKKVAQVVATPTPAPATQAAKTQFQARLDELNTDLTNADPSQSTLSLPPVDMTLTLDPLPNH